MTYTVRRCGGELIATVTFDHPKRARLLEERLLQLVAGELGISYSNGQFYAALNVNTFEELEEKAAKMQEKLEAKVDEILRLWRIVGVIVEEMLEEREQYLTQKVLKEVRKRLHNKENE